MRLLNAVVTTHLQEHMQVVVLDILVTTTLSVIVLESIVLDEVTHYAVTITTL